MTDEQKKRYNITNEKIALVNELLSGGDPNKIAEKGNISVQELLDFKTYLIDTAFHELETIKKSKKEIGRNDPCPCGSGKKYKKCCMSPSGSVPSQAAAIQLDEHQKEKRDEYISRVMQQGMTLFSSNKYEQAVILMKQNLITHPHEDRLHDVLQLSLLYLNRPEKSEQICRKRWLLAVKDKQFMREHGYQPRERDEVAPASSGFPPTAWLSKYWIAKKAVEYRSLLPADKDEQILKLVEQLKTADDLSKFQKTQQEGLTERKEALAEEIQKLITYGDVVIHYLSSNTYRYSWTCLLLPEIFAAIDTDQSIGMLLDICMFQIAYASELSMKLLEAKGERIIPFIKKAFTVNKEFDPIKTGLISVLSHIHSPGSISLLLDLLDHPDPHIVNWTGGALAHYGDTSVLPKMLAASERIGSEPRLDWGIEQLTKKKMQEN